MPETTPDVAADLEQLFEQKHRDAAATHEPTLVPHALVSDGAGILRVADEEIAGEEAEKAARDAERDASKLPRPDIAPEDQRAYNQVAAHASPAWKFAQYRAAAIANDADELAKIAACPHFDGFHREQAARKLDRSSLPAERLAELEEADREAERRIARLKAVKARVENVVHRPSLQRMGLAPVRGRDMTPAERIAWFKQRGSFADLSW
jgi:hypothetical protein